MEIKKEILDKIRRDPVLFADILKAVNTPNVKVMQDTLHRRLQRYSENARNNHAMIECLRAKGFSDEEIFETQKNSR